jgi:nitroreductase
MSFFLPLFAQHSDHLQAYSIIHVRNKRILSKLAEASLQQQIVAECSGLFTFVVEAERSAVKYRDRGRRLYALQDTTIVCAQLQLALEAHGIQSRWIGAFNDSTLTVCWREKCCRIACFWI